MRFIQHSLVWMTAFLIGIQASSVTVQEEMGDATMFTQPAATDGEQVAEMLADDSQVDPDSLLELQIIRDQLRNLTEDVSNLSTATGLGEASNTFSAQLSQIVNSSDGDAIKDLDIPELIKQWGANFVYQFDQKLEETIQYTERFYALTDRAFDTRLNILPIYQTLLDLAQRDVLSFMAGGLPLYRVSDQFSNKQLYSTSQPFSTSASLVSLLWARGLIYPSVSQIPSQPAVTQSDAVPMADVNDNLDCLLFFLGKKLQANNASLTLTMMPEVLKNVSCPVANFNDDDSWKYMDAANRFTDSESDLLIASVLNDLYIDKFDLSNDQLLQAMINFYMALEYNQPMLSVCTSVYLQLSEKDLDVCPGPDEEAIDGPCLQCTRLKEAEQLNRLDTGGTFVDLTQQLSHSLNHAYNMYVSKLNHIAGDETNDITILFPTHNSQGHWPVMSEQDSQDDILEYIDTSSRLIQAIKKYLFKQIVDQLEIIVDKRDVKSTPILSYDAILNIDNSFGSFLADPDQLGCDDVTLEEGASRLEDNLVRSELYNQVNAFIAYVAGDSLWEPYAKSPVSPMGLFMDSSNAEDKSLSYAQIWPKPSQLTCSDIAANTNKVEIFQPWFSAPADPNDPMYETNSQLLTRAELDRYRQKNNDVNLLGAIDQIQVISTRRSAYSLQLFKELAERSINLSQTGFCSVKMLGRKSAQWRFDGDWVETIWRSDTTTVLRHIAQLLAELNYRIYILIDNIETINVKNYFYGWQEIIPTMSRQRVVKVMSNFRHALTNFATLANVTKGIYNYHDDSSEDDAVI